MLGKNEYSLVCNINNKCTYGEYSIASIIDMTAFSWLMNYANRFF